MTASVRPLAKRRVSRPASPEQIVERIRLNMSAGVAGVVDAGRALAELRESLPRGAFGPMVKTRLGWNDDKAERLMAVARHEVVANSANFAEFPPSPNTLYELTKVASAELVRALADGRVNPDMKGAEASSLAKRFPAKVKRRPALEPVAADVAPVPPPPAGVEVRCADSRLAATFAGVTGDLAVFSPPYAVGVAYDLAVDNLSREEWCGLIHDACVNLVDVAGVGRIAVNVPMGVDRRPYQPLLPMVLAAVEDVAEVQAVIVWDKGTTGNRTSWGSWKSPADPAIRDRTELIVLLRTRNELRIPDGTLGVVAGRKTSPWMSDGGRFMELTQDLWSFAPARRDGTHPSPFPVELPRRCLELFGWPGCTVIDPFAGSGTTGVAALELGANAVLIDVSPGYCDVMRRRLADETKVSA